MICEISIDNKLYTKFKIDSDCTKSHEKFIDMLAKEAEKQNKTIRVVYKSKQKV